MPTTRSRARAQVQLTVPAKFPSFNWIDGVSGDKRISVVHRLILVRLCLDRRNSYDTIVHELGVRRATIFGAIDAGIKCGWLVPPIRRRPRKVNFTFSTDISMPATACAGGRS
jgi:hypothetical protein